jgi:hypothetical protein
MTEPIPGQLSLVPELAPDLTGPAGRPTRPATDASQQRDGPHGQGGSLQAPASVGRSWGLVDVPGHLREFVNVPPGGLAWRMWDPGTPAAQAALEYRQRLGTWPAAVIRNPTGGHTLAGPVADRWREAPFS